MQSQSFDLFLTKTINDLLPKECAKNLSESIRYSLLAPAKRIRPRLLLASAEMLGLNAEDVMPAAAGIEMIHCFTLIHDDLPCMDDDDIRRGRPSNHKAFGEAIALLAGDALVPMALEVFLRCRSSTTLGRDRAIFRFLEASGPRGVIGGQALEFELNEESSQRDLERVHESKTGALFAASILVPMDLAEIEEKSPQGLALSGFSHALGVSFQILDDLDDEGDQRHLNILKHMSRQEAEAWITSRLGEAEKKIVGFFGKKSKELLAVSNELLSRVKT